ncbi:energy-coupled thiamine transporter ThiT [Enterococcus sp. BWB1-3]|uniref:energy-coupled thiamine transporter ThiT n=1 Tax=unclassified Enterococcus TaxID=2608891 RepID=UPI0019204E12|nr:MULTISPECIES: energy-coupled thiamine transporter ThiT [unclassified Enterococcus]MBL1229879.1 energy-coupled thiamine transporter ThiT [Enterococcus sp. BWB1-3]MCB5951395.1 energy-coupled thiamine transporter ThiT [Enterococcus sp. BWT-B8]MCB5954953.1 energy-coupled thiamine transporter ThiT [Enterococcus sp. CWB-B31]
MSKKMDLRVWIEGTVIAAMAMALSFIPLESANAAFDLSLGMIPLVLYSYRRGALPGITAGFIWGLLSIVLGSAMKNFISVPQIIFEYPFAFAFGGMGGLFSSKIQKAISDSQSNKAVSYILIGSLTAVVSRWFWHYWAGVFVWGVYAPEGMSPYWYSLLFNGGSAIANTVLVSVVLVIIVKVAPKLFIPKMAHYINNSAKNK